MSEYRRNGCRRRCSPDPPIFFRGRTVAATSLTGNTPLRQAKHAAVAMALAGLLIAGWMSPAAATMLGANKFDLMLDYVAPVAPAGINPDGYRRVRRAMGRKAILDGRDAGLTFFRVAVTGYSPADLTMWQRDPPRFWELLDRMFDELDAAGLQLVPSFLWNTEQFPRLGHDTTATFIRDPNSASRQLMQQFLRDFIGRYGARRTILFYEMGNESNLLVDLDQRRRACKRTPCVWENSSTAELNRFAAEVAKLIKSLDPSRAVTSGYSLPRASAAHLERRPEFGSSGPDWTPDTVAEFTGNLLTTQAPFDVVSIHVYPDDEARPAGAVSGPRFEPIALSARAAHGAGKKLFIGEFGDDKGATPFMRRTFDEIVRSRVDFAAIWVWEFYQTSTYARVETGMNAEPGFTDDLIQLLIETERRAGARLPPKMPAEPRVVLTWPLPCTRVNDPTDLTAVASNGAGPVRQVEFLVDGKQVALVAAPPYRAKFNPASLGPRTAEITARAIAGPGAAAAYRSTVHLNNDGSYCNAGD
jgi:hypothetical protein